MIELFFALLPLALVIAGYFAFGRHTHHWGPWVTYVNNGGAPVMQAKTCRSQTCQKTKKRMI